jgi:DNA-directed RNA polymerase sigma subunit (sigma70/sigma32)
MCYKYLGNSPDPGQSTTSLRTPGEKPKIHMSDYSLRIKVQNGRIRAAMKAANVGSASELARLANLHPTEVGNILNLKKPARNKKTGEWATGAIRIAEALNSYPDELFTESQQIAALQTNTGEIGISEEQARALAYRLELPLLECQDATEEIEQTQTASILDEVMGYVLRPQEAAVLKARMDDSSLEELAKKYDVTRERIRQIQKKAERKMRQAAKGKYLEKFPRLAQGMRDLKQDRGPSSFYTPPDRDSVTPT